MRKDSGRPAYDEISITDIVWADLPDKDTERLVRVIEKDDASGIITVLSDVHGARRKTYHLPVNTITRIACRWSDVDAALSQKKEVSDDDHD